MMTDTAGTRTRDRSDDEPWVVAGVDTHKDTHHVAAGSAATGAGLGDMRVPATPAGYDQPRDFVRSHGRIRMIGIEGTGSYGAGLARAPGGRRRADPRGHPPPGAPRRRRGRAPIRSEPEPPPAEHWPGPTPCPWPRPAPAPANRSGCSWSSAAAR